MLAGNGVGPDAAVRENAITIAASTTHITSPIAANGYPDYLAALNHSAARGVTVDNNAALLIASIIGSDLLNEADRAQFYRELGATLPETSQWQFIDYREWTRRQAPKASAAGGEDARNEASLWEEHERALRAPWSAVQCPRVAGWLTANERALRVAVEASSRNRYYVPMSGEGDPPAVRLLTLRFVAHATVLRSIATALRARAMLRLHLGDSRAAWSDLQACHRLARLLVGGGTWYQAMVAHAIDRAAWDGQQVFNQYAVVARSDLSILTADLRALQPLASLTAEFCTSIRFTYLSCVCVAHRTSRLPAGVNRYDVREHNGRKQSPTTPKDKKPSAESPSHGQDNGRVATVRGHAHNRVGLLDGIEQRAKQINERIEGEFPKASVDWNAALQVGNQYFDRLANLATENDPAKVRHSASLLQADWVGWRLGVLKAADTDLTSVDSLSRLLALACFETVGVQAGFHLWRLDHDNVARHRLTEVGLALNAYHSDHQRYPRALSELVPKYVEKIPTDPFGSELRCRADQGGCIVYSVGPNGLDETADSPGAPRGDAAIELGGDDIGIALGVPTDGVDRSDHRREAVSDTIGRSMLESIQLINKPVPEFAAHLLGADGCMKTLTNADLSGKVAVVRAWDRDPLAGGLERVLATLDREDRAVFLLIGMEGSRNDLVTLFVQARLLGRKNVLVAIDANQSVALAFGLGGPVRRQLLFLVDPKGIIRHVQAINSDRFSPEETLSRVDALLQEGP